MFVVMARSRRLRAARKSGLFVLTWAFASAANVPHDVRREPSGGGDNHASSTGTRRDIPSERVPSSGSEKPLAASSQSSSPPGPPNSDDWTASGVSVADGAAGAGTAGAPADGVPAGGDAASPAGLPPVYVEDRGTETDAETIARFREELAPYGAWTEDPRYGAVWIPDRAIVGAEFSPYVSHGRWGIDETGQWVWLSDLPYGKVVFHYGRWVRVPAYGWAWIPGTRYAPAWVVWRVPNGARSTTFVGWAPAPPAFVWFGGVAYHYRHPVTYGWVFCPSPYVFDRWMYRHLVRDHHRAMAARRHTREHAPSRPRVGPPRSPTPRQAYVPRGSMPAERWKALRALAGTTAPGAERRTPTPTLRPLPRATPHTGADRARTPTYRTPPQRIPTARAPTAPAIRPSPGTRPPPAPRTAPVQRPAPAPAVRPPTRSVPVVRPAPAVRPAPSALPRGGASRSAPAPSRGGRSR